MYAAGEDVWVCSLLPWSFHVLGKLRGMQPNVQLHFLNQFMAFIQ